MHDLPAPIRDGALSLEVALRQRRSLRDFSTDSLDLASIGQLLWATAGACGDDGLRTAPSAGGLHLLSLRVIAANVEGLPPGSYRYEAASHALVLERPADLRPALAEAAIGDQPWVATAPALIVLAADVEHAIVHFADQPPPGQRGQRYAAMEVGHAAQNLYLQLTALGLGGVFVGGFDDHAVAEILGIEAPLRPLGLMPVGHPG